MADLRQSERVVLVPWPVCFAWIRFVMVHVMDGQRKWYDENHDTHEVAVLHFWNLPFWLAECWMRSEQQSISGQQQQRNSRLSLVRSLISFSLLLNAKINFAYNRTSVKIRSISNCRRIQLFDFTFQIFTFAFRVVSSLFAMLIVCRYQFGKIRASINCASNAPILWQCSPQYVTGECAYLTRVESFQCWLKYKWNRNGSERNRRSPNRMWATRNEIERKNRKNFSLFLGCCWCCCEQ